MEGRSSACRSRMRGTSIAGFRAAEIRNRAIMASKGGYCVFLDGDCIPRPDFVAQHRRLAEPGWFVAGNRILLSEALTGDVLAQKLEPEQWSLASLVEPPRHQPARAGAAPAARAVAQGCSRSAGKARAPAISRSRAPISTASTGSTRATTAGGWRIPISPSGSSMPASGARTGALRPACFISGTRERPRGACRPTRRGSTR